jgi:hypothetical protein
VRVTEPDLETAQGFGGNAIPMLGNFDSGPDFSLIKELHEGDGLLLSLDHNAVHNSSLSSPKDSFSLVRLLGRDRFKDHREPAKSSLQTGGLL